MKIFFDTEFTGLHQYTTLISIGLVAENGRTFYAEMYDYDETQIDEWLETNVIAKLRMTNGEILDREVHPNYLSQSENVELIGINTQELKIALSRWFASFQESIEMWSDCLAYDWVLLNHVFGHAFYLPPNVSYIPFDLCTLLHIKGYDADISREEFAGLGDKDDKHNALFDAQIIKMCHERLIKE